MGGKTYNEGDWISLNGSTGDVYDGQVPTVQPELDGDFGAIMNLAAKYTHTLVRTNADTPRDARQARAFGAQGIVFAAQNTCSSKATASRPFAK